MIVILKQIELMATIPIIQKVILFNSETKMTKSEGKYHNKIKNYNKNRPRRDEYDSIESKNPIVEEDQNIQEEKQLFYNSRKNKISTKQDYNMKKNLEFSFPEKEENMLAHYKRQIVNIKSFNPRDMNWNLQRLQNETISSYGGELNFLDNTNDILFPRNYCANSKTDIDQYSCNYCEEYYKLVLLKNVPLKLFSCTHCKNKINQQSLVYFSKKYEKEMNEEIKKNINSQLNLNSSCSFNNSLSTNPLMNNTDSIDTYNFSMKKYSNHDNNSTLDFKKENKFKICMEDVEEIINEEALDSTNKIDRREVKKEGNSFFEEKEELNENLKESFKEDIKIKKNGNDEMKKGYLLNEINYNLADAFKNKKLEMIEKLERRKHIKVVKTTEEKDPKFSTKLIKKLSDKNQRKSDKNMKTIKKNDDEPSPELLHRLAKGERVNVCD